jgi:hypothetical protein
VALGSKTTKENISQWEIIKCGISAKFNPGTPFFLLYINDLPKVSNRDNNMVLYADDILIVITDTNIHNLKINQNRTFGEINTWFNANLLTLNFQKTQYIEFRTRNGYKSPTLIEYDNRRITATMETKFLGLIIDDNLSWKHHSEYIINKLASAYFAIRNIRSLVTLDTLRSVYNAHVHSIMSYGITFWDGSTNGQRVFLMQKRIIRVKMNRRLRDSCRKIFKMMKIMTFYSQYIYALLLFMINNTNLFMTNNELHEYKTRIHNNLHLPVVNLVKFDNGAYITSIKVF